MDEKNLFENNEELEAEVTEEAVEEATEAIADSECSEDVIADSEEATEEAYGEDFDETIEKAEEYEEADDDEVFPGEEITEDGEVSYILENPPKKSKKGLVIALVLIVIIALLGGALAYEFLGNKYNRMGYADISGMTLGEMCEQIGAPIDEFKETYELPADMPDDTYFNAAYNLMPVKVIAAMNYTDFATLKTEFKIPDTYIPEGYGLIGKIKAIFSKKPVEITENTPWGIVQGELTLDICVGEENMEEFKAEYGFGDNITLETQWKEVRPTIEKESIKDRKEQEKLAAEAEAEAGEEAPVEGEAPAEGQADTADTAEPAEGEAADADAAEAE